MADKSPLRITFKFDNDLKEPIYQEFQVDDSLYESIMSGDVITIKTRHPNHGFVISVTTKGE